MLRVATSLFALGLLLAAPFAAAQPVTVETLVAPGSAIDDALALAPDGALYGSQFGSPSATITRVNVSTGATSVVASGFANANGLAVGPDGTLYAAEYGKGRIHRIPTSGARSVLHDEPSTSLSGVIYDTQNDLLYITSYDSDWIRRLRLDGTTEPIETEGLDGPAGLAFDDQNRLHIANFDDGKIFRLDGGQLRLLADLPGRVGFLAYGGGRFFATGINTHVVYAISPSGEVTTLAGTGDAGEVDGPAETAQFNGPNGIVATAAGDTLYVSDANTGSVRRIVIQTVVDAETAPEPTGALHPPAPNPVASSTTIRFDLDEPQTVELALIDPLGRHVRSLASGPRVAGRHALTLDASNLPAGIYRVTLRTHGRTESRPLVRL